MPVSVICCEAVKKRKGQQEPVELFPVLVSVLCVAYDLGTKGKKGKTKTLLMLGLVVNVIRCIVFIDHLLGNSHLYTLFLMHKIQQPCEIHCMHKETVIESVKIYRCLRPHKGKK